MAIVPAFALTSVSGQAGQMVRDAGNLQRFLDARIWFAEEQYKLAYPVFKELDLAITPEMEISQQLYTEELRFYRLACELMEDNPEAQPTAEAFLDSRAGGHLKSQLGYFLGTYYFRRQDYAQASAAFNQAGIQHLNNRQVAEMQFQHGYCHYAANRFGPAKALFNSVRQSAGSPYYADANYYYGLIALKDKQYREALKSLKLVSNHPKYRATVPFYTSGIYYALGEKALAMQTAEEALKMGNPAFRADLQQLLGHGYFEKGDYLKAQSYLESYVASAPQVSRAQFYELGFCYLQSKQYQKAIEQLKPLAGGEDSLSLHAMYLLGDAYLKTGQKSQARNAFLFCGTGNGRAAYQETALFNYGKLSYELGIDQEALPALKQYNARFPRGTHIQEARDLLVAVLGNTSNFKEALDLYESLPVKGETAKQFYPRIAFNRAQELINDRNIPEAERLLAKTLSAPYNAGVAPLAHFWQGEIDFGREQFASAIQHYREYLRNPVVSGEANAFNASYSLGYALLRLQEYREATVVFSELSSARPVSEPQQLDVWLRLGDGYYMQKDFAKAGNWYGKVASARGFGADYALLQNAMIAGAQAKPVEKINLLRSVIQQYPRSPLVPDAHMEAADTYLASEKYKDALPFLGKIIEMPGADRLKPEAYLKTGLAYVNLGNDAEALSAFKNLLKKYPQSQQSNEALDNVRNIYIDQGKPDELIAFLREVGRVLDMPEADSLTYAAAERQLEEGKKSQALEGFQKYLTGFPQGRYVVDAAFYAGELSRDAKKADDALRFYEMVAAQTPNAYAERALLFLSRTHYFDRKDYLKALEYFTLLKGYATNGQTRMEAMRGMVRCQYYLDDYSNAVPNARELLQQGGAGSDDKTFANLVLGKHARAQGKCEEAIPYFKTAASLSKAEFGAEARYWQAYCLYEMNKLAEAEKMAFDAAGKSGSYAIWVEKSYLLLGDIFLKQQDFFNAKATYKSVAENATVPELKKEAVEKLARAEELSAAAAKMGGK